MTPLKISLISPLSFSTCRATTIKQINLKPTASQYVTKPSYHPSFSRNHVGVIRQSRSVDERGKRPGKGGRAAPCGCAAATLADELHDPDLPCLPCHARAARCRGYGYMPWRPILRRSMAIDNWGGSWTNLLHETQAAESVLTSRGAGLGNGFRI